MTENKNIKLSIQSITVPKFNIDPKEELMKYFQENKEPFSKYIFEINCGIQGFISNNLVKISVIIKIFMDMEKKIGLGEFQIDNIYQMENIKEYHIENENILKLPTQIQATLISISLSHSRAMLVAKCAGTLLQNAILPILSPIDFITKLDETEKLKNEIEKDPKEIVDNLVNEGKEER